MKNSEPNREHYRKENIDRLFDICDIKKYDILVNIDVKSKQLSIDVVDKKGKLVIAEETVSKDEYIDDAAIRIINRLAKRK